VFLGIMHNVVSAQARPKSPLYGGTRKFRQMLTQYKKDTPAPSFSYLKSTLAAAMDKVGRLVR
jgi:hypothetical protein